MNDSANSPQALPHRQRVNSPPTVRKLARAMPDISSSQFRSPPVFARPNVLPQEWQPFYSFLFDTVRAVINVRHLPLDELCENNGLVTYKDFAYYVRCPVTGGVAKVFSRENCTQLLIELSIPKWLTGQNLVGIDNLHEGCVQSIKRVSHLMNLRPTDAERAAIKNGQYHFTRTDLAGHIDCGTAERATAMMAALRGYIVGKAKDVGFYGLETAYIGQHSSNWALKFYRKDIELADNPMGEDVYDREYLLTQADGLIRVELVLRRSQLKYRGLATPAAWTKGFAQQLLADIMSRFLDVDGTVPDVAAISKLSPVLQMKMKAWMRGELTAFSVNVSQDTYRRSRRTVLKTTGIDVYSHLSPKEQRSAFLTISDMIKRGFGFKSYGHKWDQLCRVAAAPEPRVVMPMRKATAKMTKRTAQVRAAPAKPVTATKKKRPR